MYWLRGPSQQVGSKNNFLFAKNVLQSQENTAVIVRETAIATQTRYMEVEKYGGGRARTCTLRFIRSRSKSRQNNY